MATWNAESNRAYGVSLPSSETQICWITFRAELEGVYGSSAGC